jgi:hypothetical protein
MKRGKSDLEARTRYPCIPCSHHASHIHLHDDEKVQLAEAYRDAQHYAGHCCAVCGIRDPVSAYSCKMFTLAGPPCAGPGYLRRRGDPDSDSPIVEQLIELPPWIRMSCAAAAVLEADACEIYISKRNDKRGITGSNGSDAPAALTQYTSAPSGSPRTLHRAVDTIGGVVLCLMPSRPPHGHHGRSVFGISLAALPGSTPVAKPKPRAGQQGSGAYRDFVRANLGKHKGNMKAVAAAYRAQKGGGDAHGQFMKATHSYCAQKGGHFYNVKGEARSTKISMARNITKISRLRKRCNQQIPTNTINLP